MIIRRPVWRLDRRWVERAGVVADNCRMTAHESYPASDPLLHHFHHQWKHIRRLTHDLLLALSEGELTASPGGELGPWWKQFRHVGRVQENYLQALDSGTIDFGIEGTTYAGGVSKEALGDYLVQLDRRLQAFLDGGFPRQTVNWFGRPKPVAEHLLLMADHETLHHGQWIAYRKLLGGAFPKSWAVWGV